MDEKLSGFFDNPLILNSIIEGWNIVLRIYEPAEADCDGGRVLAGLEAGE